MTKLYIRIDLNFSIRICRLKVTDAYLVFNQTIVLIYDAGGNYLAYRYGIGEGGYVCSL